MACKDRLKAAIVFALLTDHYVAGFQAVTPTGLPASRRGFALSSTASFPPPTLEAQLPPPTVQPNAQPPTRSLRLTKPLGLVLAEESVGGPALVKEVKPGGSAAAMGVFPGDRLITINGADVTRRPFADVVDQMVRAGATLEMTFGQPGSRAGASPAAALKAAQLAKAPPSAALPWSATPAALAADLSRGAVGTAGGALAGNRGFDPLGLGRDRKRLLSLREAEIKHARLAMVAAVGWPVAELGDDGVAALLGLPSVLSATGGLNPSLLNGGLLDAAPPAFWLACLAFTAQVEGAANRRRAAATVTNAPWLPGDLGFDPFGAYPTTAAARARRQESELTHGRLAMLAVAGFAAQEAATRQPVVPDAASLEAAAGAAATAAAGATAVAWSSLLGAQLGAVL